MSEEENKKLVNQSQPLANGSSECLAAPEAGDGQSGLVWHEVNNDDTATLPPLDKIVVLCYLSDNNDGQVVQLGGRAVENDFDDTFGWCWGVLDSAYFAKDWEPKLYGIEVDDDYRVTHWADIAWPTANAQARQAGDNNATPE